MQQGNRCGRQRPPGGQLGSESLELPGRGEIAVPEQPGRLLECRMCGELADRKASDDQLSALAVHMTQTRRRRDYAFEAAGEHAATVSSVYDAVNVDS